MRHALLASKGFCQSARVFKEQGRCLPGKLSEITDKMGLVIIATVSRNRCPALVVAIDSAKDLLETQYSAK
jgi:hypothetical protein